MKLYNTTEIKCKEIKYQSKIFSFVDYENVHSYDNKWNERIHIYFEK